MDHCNNVESSEVIVPSGVPREIGFGNFCFGRRVLSELPRMRNVDFPYTNQDDVINRRHEVSIKEYLGLNTHNQSYVEIGGYKRKGIFRFPDLPTEIRLHILRLLLAPLFLYDERLQLSVPKFIINKRVFEFVGEHFTGGIKQYLVGCDLPLFSHDKESPFDVYQSMSIEKKSKVKETYTSLKKAYQFETKHHPKRTTRYELFVMQNERGSMKYEFDADFTMVELVRNLSNVSSIMRQGLGSVIWTHTKFYIHSEALTSHATLSCLMERPQIRKGIHDVHLALDLREGVDPLREYSDIPNFKLTCLYMSTVLELSYLKISIKIEDDEFDDDRLAELYHTTGQFSGLDIIRSIKVTKEFELAFGRDRTDWDKEEEEGEKKGLLQLHSLLLPNTLRASNTEGANIDGKTKCKMASRRQTDGQSRITTCS